MIIVTMLAISTVSAIVPLGFSTITSRPVLFPYGSTTTTPVDPMSVTAGGNISINTNGMSISGAQVWLWLSTYGGSEISTVLGDRCYAGPFLLTDLIDTVAVHQYSINTAALATLLGPFQTEGRTYQYTVGNGWINGTIPLIVQGTNVNYWVKLTDISPRDAIVGSEVGVSTNRVTFTAGFGATPLTGAPATPVNVSGYAIPTGILYNITQGTQVVNTFVGSTTHNESGWLWTGFTVPFNILDLKGLTSPAPTMTGGITINVINHNTTVTDATFNFVQTFREVYLPTGTFRAHGGTYTGYTLNTGAAYNVTLNWFPASGTASIYLNTTLVSSAIALNGTGGNGYTTMTIPSLITGNYVFRVNDNNNVNYTFTVHITMVPFITVAPTSGYAGDAFTVTGQNFLDYVGQYVTLYFENSIASPNFLRMLNFTVPSSTWTTASLVVPQSYGGTRLVQARDTAGTSTIASTTFKVLARLNVIPDIVTNNCSVIQVVGTGFYLESPIEDWFFYVDNSMYFGDIEDWGKGINATGYILTELVAAGFRPGLHEVHVIPDSEGALPWTVFAKDCFIVSTDGDPIVAYLESINATVVSISEGTATIITSVGDLNVSLSEIDAKIVALNGTIATIQTSVGQLDVSLTAINAQIVALEGTVATVATDVGTVKTSVSNLGGKITSIQGDMATVKTNIGTVKTSVESLGATITSIDDTVATIDTALGTVQTSINSLDTAITAIDGDVVTIKTSLGTIEGTITEIDGTVATIETDLGTVKVDLASAKTNIASVKTTVDDSLPVTVDMLPVWIAVVLALIAAIGSIAGVFIIQRKIAG